MRISIISQEFSKKLIKNLIRFSWESLRLNLIRSRFFLGRDGDMGNKHQQNTITFVWWDHICILNYKFFNITVDSRFNEQMGPEKGSSLNRNSFIQKTHLRFLIRKNQNSSKITTKKFIILDENKYFKPNFKI